MHSRSRILTGVGAVLIFLSLSFGVLNERVYAQSETLFAQLRTSPPQDQSGNVRLPAEGGTVQFFFDESRGAIATYAVDLDTSKDSDGDGSPNNDPDNVLHPSFRSGEPWSVNLRAAPGESGRSIQLRVTAETGETSTASLALLFDPLLTTPPRSSSFPAVVPEESVGQNLALLSDQSVIRVGEQFTLRLHNVPSGIASYSWDLQSDGREDAETVAPFLLLEPDAAGALPVRVTLQDAAGNPMQTISNEFTVTVVTLEEEEIPEEVEGSLLAIQADIEGLQVSFTISPDIPLNLFRLHPTWTFGDGKESFLLEPVYTYGASGTYEVTLTLQDPATGEDVTSASTRVNVSGVPAGEISEEGGFMGGIRAFFRIVGSIFSGVFAAILVLLGISLLTLLLFFGYVWMEAKRTNQQTSEILAEWKRKFFRGVDEQPLPRPSSLPPQKIATPPSRPTPPSPPAPPPTPPKPPAPLPSPSSPPPVSAPPIITEEAVLPAWLRPKTTPPSGPPAPSKPPSLPPRASGNPPKPSVPPPSSPPPPPPPPPPKPPAPSAILSPSSPPASLPSTPKTTPTPPPSTPPILPPGTSSPPSAQLPSPPKTPPPLMTPTSSPLPILPAPPLALSNEEPLAFIKAEDIPEEDSEEEK